MANKRHHGGMHAAEYMGGVDPRRRQEMMDGMMIHEDHSAVANLPQQVIQRTYPKAGHMAAPYLDDTMRGVDDQINESGRKMLQHFSGKKM